MSRTSVVAWVALVAAMVAIPVVAATPATTGWSLVPQPAILKPAAGGAVRVANGDCVAVSAADDRRALDAARRLMTRVAAIRDLHLQACASDKQPRITFKLDPKAAIQSDAGYRIDIGHAQILATARTARGLFYASVTVGQLLTPNAAKGSVEVADGSIVDQPRYSWRGLMLDSARHFQSVADIKQLLDWMALSKLNVLHWHLTDDQGWRLQIKRYPKLTSIGACRKAIGPDAALTGGPDKPYCGFYTQAEVRDLVRYAADRFISIVPEIEIPGHAQAALAAYPDLGVTGKRPQVSTDWGINTWLYAPNQHSIKFLENVLDEVMTLFPSKYIHVGGDEAAKDQWQASPQVRAKLKKLGLKNMNQLQGWMIGQIGQYLAARGRTLVGWDEILGGKLPKSAVVMSWHGVSGAVEAAAKGHDAILAPSPVLYLDHVQSSAHDEPPARPQVESLQDVYSFNPQPASLSAAQARHILGIQGNLWTEYMPTFARDQHAIFPRMAAWAEVAWSPASAIDWNGFVGRMQAEVARYQGLGIAYADSAWAPRFDLQSDGRGEIRVTLSNQVDRGQIHFTTDGSDPTLQSPRYAQPITLSADRITTVKAATFAASGLRLAAVRARRIDAESLLTRNSDQLQTCTNPHGIALRIEDDRPLDGPRPVYKVDIGDTCWIWQNAPLDGVREIAVRVGNLPWNYQLWHDDAKVVVRPKATPAGEFQIHLDSCDGPLLATLPLAKAAQTKLQTTLTADIPATAGHHNLCVFATGDPHDGMWVIDKIELLRDAGSDLRP